MERKKGKGKLFGMVLLSLLLVAGCKEADTGAFSGDFARGKETVPVPVSESYKSASLLSGNSELLCVPDISATRVSGAEPYLLLYRIDFPKAIEEADVMKRLFPASVTKLLTAYTAVKHADLTDMVTISHRASHLNIEGAMLCGFSEGDTISLRDLLSAMLVASGNDAAIAVAEHVSGSVDEFAALMNQEIRKLGGLHSNFVNPHGLHNEKHYTTAYDIYLVLNAFFRDEELLSLLRQSSCTVSYKNASGIQAIKTFQTTNLYLSKEKELPEQIEVIGGKTGTTNAAGCCLVQLFATDNGNIYVAEVFGAKDYTALYDKMTELMLLALASEE